MKLDLGELIFMSSTLFYTFTHRMRSSVLKVNLEILKHSDKILWDPVFAECRQYWMN